MLSVSVCDSSSVSVSKCVSIKMNPIIIIITMQQEETCPFLGLCCISLVTPTTLLQSYPTEAMSRKGGDLYLSRTLLHFSAHTTSLVSLSHTRRRPPAAEDGARPFHQQQHRVCVCGSSGFGTIEHCYQGQKRQRIAV